MLANAMPTTPPGSATWSSAARIARGAAPPQALAIVLGPFRARVGDRRRLAGDRDHAAGGIDDDRLGVGRAGVGPDQQWPRPARLPCYHARPLAAGDAQRALRRRRAWRRLRDWGGKATARTGFGRASLPVRALGPRGGPYPDTTLLATARRAALVAEETRDSVAKTVLDELKATQPGRRREPRQE